MSDARTILSVRKCPCGDKGCRCYYVDPLWNFCQGAGCDRSAALRIKRAMLNVYPHEYASGKDDE